ncbi:MAG: MarR family transcriptional regulator [Clostridiales bacterium]|nr:MarR family transcriptional regulator [Clostridiales bacterium]
MIDEKNMIFLRLLRQTSRGIKRVIFKKMNTENYSHSQINLILHLNGNKKRPINLLSKIVQIQKSNMTTLIDSLEKENIVSRSRDLNDKRVIHLNLTTKGIIIKKQLLEEYQQHLNEILKDVTEEELDQAIASLLALKEKIWGKYD